MPRTLPWEKTRGPTTATRPKRPASVPSSVWKKQRVQSKASDLQDNEEVLSRREPPASLGRHGILQGIQLMFINLYRMSFVIISTTRSTTREVKLHVIIHVHQLIEISFMREGIDCDDRFRMVEDEFLSVARSFTAHLHAAEYKRQQKMVKSRNADTINSISRPVTGKMPDHTRRRVEGVARAKHHGVIVQSLFGKKTGNDGISDDSDDGEGLPYVGTTLHVLMDSPRKKALSIGKSGFFAASTRAAAGFSKPATKCRPDRKSMMSSPQPKSIARQTKTTMVHYTTNLLSEDDGDDDDDLDAPILAPKLVPRHRTPQDTSIIISAPGRPSSLTLNQNSSPVSSLKSPGFKASVKEESDVLRFDDFPEFLSKATPRSSRLERARQRKIQLEGSNQAQNKPNDIPGFI